MAQNRYMHPRNIYRTPPDYRLLAIQYPEFRKRCRLQLSGKVSLNYRNVKNLEVLAQTLLKHDFQLDITFPKDCLIPTVPLRLNYVLWIEDLMNHISAQTPRGVDVGCGAICIYGMLCAKKFNWSLSCIETQEISIDSSQENITRNNFDHLLKVFEQKDRKKIYAGTDIFANNSTYDFSMCNPPFYYVKENKKYKKRRKTNHHCNNGNDTELQYEGGEINFVTKMIVESIGLQSKIKIYTTMLRFKQSLDKVIDLLKSKHIENYTTTEFCQGKVCRFGIGWSFEPKTEFDLTKVIKHFTRN